MRMITFSQLAYYPFQKPEQILFVYKRSWQHSENMLIKYTFFSMPNVGIKCCRPGNENIAFFHQNGLIKIFSGSIKY